jgi:hypothetical protein
MKKSKKCKETGCLLKLMIVCVALSIAMLAIVAYDKLIKSDNNEVCECAK